MYEEMAQTYSAVFSPEVFVLLCGVVAIGYEWRGSPDRSVRGLSARLGVLSVAWSIAFAVYKGVPQVLGPLPSWGADATGSVGLALGLSVLWVVWRGRAWGRLVSTFAAVLVGVTVPHLLITPVWDISTHVLYTATPAGVLWLADRRFAPLALVPVGMVLSRPLAGAHTWPQSVAGLLLAVVALAAFRAVRDQSEGGVFGTADATEVE